MTETPPARYTIDPGDKAVYDETSIMAYCYNQLRQLGRPAQLRVLAWIHARLDDQDREGPS